MKQQPITSTPADSNDPSETSTLADLPQPSKPIQPSTHRPGSPDISYPYQTTDLPGDVGDDEYRETARSGVVAPSDAILNAAARLPSIDPEKARRMKDVKLVVFKPNDPEDPRTWSRLYRWYLTGLVAMAVVCAAFGSAVVTGDFEGIESEFGVSEVTTALTVSLMVCGFGLGPLAWGPLSEIYGRRWLWVSSFWIYTIFNIQCGLAKNIGTLLSGRFLCGLFASSALVIAGGTISDIWDNNERGFAIALFAAAPYGGPVLGPIVGGFVGETVGWRDIIWANLAFAGAVSALLTFIPETYAPQILKRRARKLREQTGLDTYVTEQELFPRPFAEIIVETLIRPFTMLLTEPILLFVSLYIAMIYGLLYAYFFSFPVVFGEGYGWNDGLVGLSFCPILIGVALALAFMPFLENMFHKQVEKKGGKADPEDRLPGMMIAAPWIPISLFIFAWTSPPIVQPGGGNWVGPVSAGIPFGFGMVVVYFSANAYLIDTFGSCVASALAAKTVIRSGLGAAMPLFMVAMFHNLGNEWAATLLAFLALVIVPIPFYFYFYGAKVRARSKLASAA
ncbi:MFS general substrate transporter [Peniophora sp. CONT]|nr:MFS general substrate transporter [Peniophora sp. CONT]